LPSPADLNTRKTAARVCLDREGRGNVRLKKCLAKNKNDGREAMKSFQVAEFNAP
jgi:hypothetical protein